MGKNKRKGTIKSSRKIDVSAEERVLEARNVDGDASSRKAKSLKFFVDKQRAKETARDHWAGRVLRRDTLFEDSDTARRAVKAAARATADAVPASAAVALAARDKREAAEVAARNTAARAERRVARADARGVYDLWDAAANNGRPRDCPSAFRAGAAPGAPKLTAAVENAWLAHVEHGVPHAPRTRQEAQSALPGLALPRTEESYRPTAAAVERRVARAEAQRARVQRAAAALERRLEGTRVTALVRLGRGARSAAAAAAATAEAFVEAPTLPDGTGIVLPGRSDLGDQQPPLKKTRFAELEVEGNENDEKKKNQGKKGKKEGKNQNKEVKKEKDDKNSDQSGDESDEDSEMEGVAETMLAAKDALRRAHAERQRASRRARRQGTVAGKDVARVAALAAETDAMLERRAAAAARRGARRAAWRATHGLAFGTHRYRPERPSTDVAAAARTAAGLRALRSEGPALLHDRLDSYRRRNIVLAPGGRPSNGRRKLRFVERRARRIPTGLSHEEIVEYISKL